MNDIISMMMREFILSGTNTAMLTIFAAHMLKRKKSYTAVIVVDIVKIILVNLIVAVPYGEILRTNRVVQGVYIIVAIIFSLALYFAFFYTFEGERVKIVVVATISEILAVCITNPVNMGLNAMRGESSLVEYTKFHVSDIAFIILVFVTPLICKILEPIFKRLREWKIKMKCKEKQIDTHFRLQEYRKGEIREENLAELVNYLLESFVSGNATKKVSLQMASLKGQLILVLTGDGKNVEISKRRIKKYMKGYQTVLSQSVASKQIELKLIIA